MQRSQRAAYLPGTHRVLACWEVPPSHQDPPLACMCMSTYVVKYLYAQNMLKGVASVPPEDEGPQAESP